MLNNFCLLNRNANLANKYTLTRILYLSKVHFEKVKLLPMGGPIVKRSRWEGQTSQGQHVNVKNVKARSQYYKINLVLKKLLESVLLLFQLKFNFLI